MEKLVLVQPPRPATADDLVHLFMQPELSPAVPTNLRELFDLARGVCLYGWFFYPLYQVGEERLFQVLDAAVGAKCEQHGGPKTSTSFSSRFSWLLWRGVIREEDRQRWDMLRRFRNFPSHQAMLMTHPPGLVLVSFRLAAQLINALFAWTDTDDSSP